MPWRRIQAVTRLRSEFLSNVAPVLAKDRMNGGHELVSFGRSIGNSGSQAGVWTGSPPPAAPERQRQPASVTTSHRRRRTSTVPCEWHYLVSVFPEVAHVAPVNAGGIPLQVTHPDFARGYDAGESAGELLDRALSIPGLKAVRPEHA